VRARHAQQHGIELRLRPEADSIEVAKVVTAVLNSAHHETQDFTVTIPAALLAQQQRTRNGRARSASGARWAREDWISCGSS
jgi:hypothetical protein